MKKIFLILISLFIFVVSISCISATSLDVDDVVASEGPALLGGGIHGGFSGGIGSINLNT